MDRRFNYRWLAIVGFILLDIFVFVNCILYTVNNTGIFHTTNPVDLSYHYQAVGTLSGDQLLNLNQHLLSKGEEVVTGYTMGSNKEISLSGDVVVVGTAEITNPSTFNLKLTEVSTATLSARAFGVAALLGAGCWFIGALVLSGLCSWAKSRKEGDTSKDELSEVNPTVLQLKDRIDIPHNISGLIGIRQWKVSDSSLGSTAREDHVWRSKVEVADTTPKKSNDNGVYAYRLGSSPPYWDHHLGIVELSGKCLGHKDGIIRAERGTILTVITKDIQWGANISRNYDIPVVYSPHVMNTFRDWLLNGEGLYWMQHNKELLTTLLKRPVSIEEEVIKILDAKAF